MSKATQHPCLSIREALIRDGLYEAPPGEEARTPHPSGDGVNGWRIAAHPFLLSASEVEFFHALGDHLLAFYGALNRLYQASFRGTQPSWVAEYLDLGKPDWLVSYARMKRFRDHLPGVIRPDLILTEEGMVITELDSVPGGMGLTGALSRAYAEAGSNGWELIGGRDGMVRGLGAMLREQAGDRPGATAIVVSDESKDYRPEMVWMAARLREVGLDASCLEPREVQFTEESLLRSDARGRSPIAVVYRFFELFDLMNVPKSELLMYSAKKNRVAVTPPFKPALEEKLALALLQHPVLRPFWQDELGPDALSALGTLVPRTWILDPRPVPPAAIIPGLYLLQRPVADWRELSAATQKDRRYAIKPSGFSELAWGSRGVSIGHDLSQQDWADTLDRALASFWSTPSILQEFHKGRQVELSYYDAATDELVPMSGRVRLSPYYFVAGGRAELAGILATVCPLDKKLIHGMRDAIMAPCATAREAG